MTTKHFAINTRDTDVAEFDVRGGIEAQLVSIRRATVSCSWYHISAALGNTFDLREAATDYTVTIPAGNYSITSIATALQTAIAATLAANTYTVATNTDTGVLTITRTAGAANWSVRFASYPRMAKVLGFAATDQAPAAVVSVSGSSPVWLEPAYVWLNSPEISRVMQVVDGYQKIAAIPVSTMFENATLENDAETDIYATGFVTYIGRYRFYLTDEFSDTVRLPMNGGTIMVEVWMKDTRL